MKNSRSSKKLYLISLAGACVVMLALMIALITQLAAIAEENRVQSHGSEGQALPSVAEAPSPEPTPEITPTPEPVSYVHIPHAVDLREYLPDAQFDIINATENNVTGRILYPAIPLMEEESAALLKEAYEIFKADGYTMVIYDAYRPKSAQKALYDIVKDHRFIADPYTSRSWHNLGRAVDISLAHSETGELLEMPSPMHTFNESAMRRFHDSWSPEVRQNVDYMTDVMTSCGFGTITSEWWHFEYTGSGYFLEDDMDLEFLANRVSKAPKSRKTLISCEY